MRSTRSTARRCSTSATPTRYIPTEGVEAVNAAIDGRPGFVLNVENAGHAFDNHESEMFYDESAAQAAWAKTMAFLGRHLPDRLSGVASTQVGAATAYLTRSDHPSSDRISAVSAG